MLKRIGCWQELDVLGTPEELKESDRLNDVHMSDPPENHDKNWAACCAHANAVAKRHGLGPGTYAFSHAVAGSDRLWILLDE